MAKMTAQEKKVVELLAAAWNAFCELPPNSKWEQIEFMMIIHSAQNLVGARRTWDEDFGNNEHLEGHPHYDC